jgi:hypothetical protein
LPYGTWNAGLALLAWSLLLTVPIFLIGGLLGALAWLAAGRVYLSAELFGRAPRQF